jgi:outer membrane protein assembly factor BamB
VERRWTCRIALVVVSVVLLAACDWSQVGFDPSHTGDNSAEPTLTASSVKHLTPAWSVADSNASNVLVTNGTVYANERRDLDSPDVARAFRVADGTVRWVASNPDGSEVIAVGNGLVYYEGGDQTVLTRDAATGARRWSTPGRPLLLDASLMYAATTSSVVALTPSGSARWSVPAVGEVVSAAVQGGQLVVASFVATQNPPGGFVVISTYDESDGVLLRRVGVVPKNADGTVDRPIAFSAGPKLIYLIGSRDLFAVDPATGAVGWHAASGGVNVTPRALVVTRSATVTGGPASVSALDPATGASLWTATLSGSIDGAAVAGDVVFVGHTSFGPMLGMLVYDLRTGELLTSSTEVCCGPIPAAGHVFVAGSRGLEALAPS